ncbi:MAG: hypothetical protein IPH58_05090 [Sphingobacteriales bacterium]|nr:hypothetical protein [Sphingobacteriales bacterium]
MKRYFKSKTVFETQDIAAFYEQTEKNIKSTTVNWRVHTLVQSGVLQRIGRGKFTLGEGKSYVPEISSGTKKNFQKTESGISFC